MKYPECPELEAGQCHLINDALGWNHGIPASVCNRCWNAGGPSGGGGVRSEVVELTIAGLAKQRLNNRNVRQVLKAKHGREVAEPESWVDRYIDRNRCAVVRAAQRMGGGAMDRVIEEEGGKRRFGSVVVVGNGPSATSAEMGERIDGFDEVVRFNDYRIEGFEKQVGTKTTVWVRFNDQRLMRAESTASRRVMVYVNGVPDGAWPEWKAKGWESMPAKAYHAAWRASNKGQMRQKPSSGLVAVMWLLETYERVHIWGFDHFKGWEPYRRAEPTSYHHHHYWGNDVKPDGVLMRHPMHKGDEAGAFRDLEERGLVVRL